MNPGVVEIVVGDIMRQVAFDNTERTLDRSKLNDGGIETISLPKPVRYIS